jgi:hypothetical protein
VRRATCTFFLFLTASVVLVSLIPLSDLPGTAYNEADTPVNQVAPVVSGLALVSVRPAVTPAILPRCGGEAGSISRKPLKRNLLYRLFPRNQHSLQDLLCTFLI